MTEQHPTPKLKCPFCEGEDFDHGREIYAGADHVMYCMKTPPPRSFPDPKGALKMRGAVCLSCGYVVMMVDTHDLYGTPKAEAGEAAQASPPASTPSRGEGISSALDRLKDSHIRSRRPAVPPGTFPPDDKNGADLL